MQAPKSPAHYRRVEKNTHDPESFEGRVTMTGTGGHDHRDTHRTFLARSLPIVAILVADARLSGNGFDTHNLRHSDAVASGRGVHSIA